MARICFILVAGLDASLPPRAGAAATLADFPWRTVLGPVTPAVTCVVQATLTTGVAPEKHGIIANGLYTYNDLSIHQHLDTASYPEFRRQISFWEQANALLEAPRLWRGCPERTALLFWQQSMPDAADIILTPKPEHTPGGITPSVCWSRPAGLYPHLVSRLGPFPLEHYWGPRAGLPASQWIVRAAMDVWQNNPVDLQLVYVPHLDYNLQRLGPEHPALAADVAAVDALLAPLVRQVRADGGRVIIAGDYAMHGVSRAVFPNLALRRAGLLATRPDENGKLLIDYRAAAAVAMVDHQVAHVYCAPSAIDSAADVFRKLPGVARVVRSTPDKRELGLANSRSGSLVLLSAAEEWFAHDWWLSDEEKPPWQFSVDIHRKPGYDPRELFFDPARRCIAQDTALVKGSHGVPGTDPNRWPLLLSDVPLPEGNDYLPAIQCAHWLCSLPALEHA